MRILIFLLLLVGFGVSGCYSQNETQPTAKEDKADSYNWDFGKVKEGQIAEHVFTLKNKSNKVLTITGINTSCSCTSSEIKDKTLLPGKSTKVTVRFNSKGYVPAKISQHVYVNTDNPDNPVLKFKIQAEIVK